MLGVCTVNDNLSCTPFERARYQRLVMLFNVRVLVQLPELQCLVDYFRNQEHHENNL